MRSTRGNCRLFRKEEELLAEQQPMQHDYFTLRFIFIGSYLLRAIGMKESVSEIITRLRLTERGN